MKAAAPWFLALLVAVRGVAGCGASEAPPKSINDADHAEAAPPPRATKAAEPTPSKPDAAPPSEPTKIGQDEAGAADEETRKLVRAMVERVAKARGLPVKREVKSRELARPAMLERIRAQVEKDQPMDVVARQGEILTALELVPPEYDFVAGTFRLIEGQIAGFYTPDDETMYLADDLSEREAEETLAHELVHALQDQSYKLGALLKYAPSDSDRLSAVHALAEGDAMSAMFDVTLGSAFKMSESALRRILAISTAMTVTGATTPRVLQSALAAPYADGYSFVQELRRRGGWKAVDAAWRALPETTEQLLHLDKFDTMEAALPVPSISVSALGDGYQQVLDDEMGEQGLRIVLETWTTLPSAKSGAAGWGGDRYFIARKEGPPGSGSEEVAAAWTLRFDTPADAAEAAAIVKKRFGTACRVRSGQGPITWAMQGDAIVLTAGPYERRGQTLKGTGKCATATAWLASILKQLKPTP